MTPAEEKKLLDLVASQGNTIKSLQSTLSQTQKNVTDSITDQTLNFGIRLTNLTAIGENALKSVSSAFDFVTKDGGKAFHELDLYGTQIQQSFGVSKERLDEFRYSIAETTPELVKMGLEQDTAVKSFTAIAKSLGTAASIGNEAIIEMSAAAKLTGQDVGTLAGSFREVGVSIYDVGEKMKDVTNYAKSVGVSVSAVSEGVVKNIKNLNLFNFEGGVKGLTSMAAQAARLGVDMGKVMAKAEELFDPEKAIDMSARLQALGVQSSALLDPLKAMDLAQNDPEGLQKEMINISKEFTKFNEQTKQFEIMPGAKRRLREVAHELGMDADELARMSINAADFDKKMSQIEFPELAKDKETKEMIASMAQLKDGKAMINIKNEQTGEVELKQVGQLTGKDIESLKMSQEESGKSVEQLAIDQLDELKQIKGLMDGTLKAAEYGKATTPALSKLFYGLRSVEKSVAQRTSEQSTTKGVRNTVGSLTQPIEDLAVSTIKGDEMGQATSIQKLIMNTKDLSDKGIAVMKSIGEGVTSDVKDILGKAYMDKPVQKTEVIYKHEGTITLKGEGNVKGQNEIDLSNPETGIKLRNAIEGGTAPSATTGAKNQ